MGKPFRCFEMTLISDFPSFYSVFERSLTLHKTTFPPKFKPKTGRPPAWQTGVARIVIELDTYTPADLATESNNGGGHDEEALDSPSDAQSNDETENGDGEETGNMG